ncbi:hypothetical protein ACFOW4_11365 [Micromonospora sp. GCM10011542]|uniref:hypothetical protein n=1 Tax=Micromonospora sp. GCM10011542 TaxID=3317337 RepID=UPI00361295B0
MSYRDWGRGEGSPRERQPIPPWGDPADPLPVDPYDGGRYRPSGRRSALDRGQDEPVDAYLPRWALESGVRRADGGGRHAAPDDDEPDEPRSVGEWRSTATASSWQGGRGASWREPSAIGAAPESEHTREWTLDRPQEQGYVGSRRADAVEEEPVSSAAPDRRPRRAPAGRPQVVWSGGEQESAVDEPVSRAAQRPTRRSRRATEESRSSPAVDPWSRGAEPEPSYAPAVDPWDASGLHAWPPAPGGDRWDRTEASGQWTAPESTGGWVQQPDQTGQWDRYAEDDDRLDRTVPPRSGRSVKAESWPVRESGFWSGTRLADDDPRWMDPPSAAPRSPVVAYTAPRPRSTAAPRVGPSRRAEPASTEAARRRLATVGTGGWGRRLEDDLLDPDPGGPFRPLLYTAACYLVPAVLVFVWLLTLDGRAPAGCVTDISGGGCESPRSHALGSLLAGAPRFGLALVSSLVVAALLRRVGTTWRSATIALAAAVVGGGLSTVLVSAVTGQPIG